MQTPLRIRNLGKYPTWRCPRCFLFYFAVCITAVILSNPPGFAADEVASETRDLSRVKVVEPILRLDVPSHTAAVRAIAYAPSGNALYSGGLDKVVQVWNLRALPGLRDLKRTYLKQRTIRWQVARGLRGSIYALDVSPAGDTLAFAGYGFTGGLGEIALFNPVTGSLKQTLSGHRQTVVGLDFSPTDNWFTSSDAAGEVRLWHGPDWTSTTVRKADPDVYEKEIVEAIKKQPVFRPILALGKDRIVFPMCEGKTNSGTLIWKLSEASVQNSNIKEWKGKHYGMVTALAGSADGRLVASADLAGRLLLWNNARDAQTIRLPTKRIIVSLAFDNTARYLAVGTAVSGRDQKAELLVWDLIDHRFVRDITRQDHIWACAFSPNGKQVAFSGGAKNEVTLVTRDGDDAQWNLGGKAARVLKVAFTSDPKSRRFAWGTDFTQNAGKIEAGPLQRWFDPSRSILGKISKDNTSKWLDSQAFASGWGLRPAKSGNMRLFHSGQQRGSIRLNEITDGRARCHCWIPNSRGEPVAVAIGTDLHNGIYIYALANSGDCKLLRHFRDHNDFVTSVGVSADGSYLISGSADSTVKVWPLDDLDSLEPTWHRWGTLFETRESKLVVSEIDEAGPLYARGTRVGDVVSKLSWPKGKKIVTTTNSEEMLRHLHELPWMTQVVFEIQGRNNSHEVFQRLPAWEPLATHFTSGSEEWAYWTPQGYYDSSANGNVVFGWQVNRGLSSPPDYYRADQFRRRLERSDLMQHLLEGGSLAAAFRLSVENLPPRVDRVLSEQITATPSVEIISPTPSDILEGGTITVQARIRWQNEGVLIRQRAFADGVVGGKARLVTQNNNAEKRESIYEWDVSLPFQEDHLIQVIAATDAETTAFSNMRISRSLSNLRRPRKPKLYIVAVGINEYRDSRIPELGYSVDDATSLLSVVQSNASNLFDVSEHVLLLNEKVTRRRWRSELASLAERLRPGVQPDDLMILYLAGHGVTGGDENRYFFLGYDYDYSDYANGDFQGCISWQDFQLLADLPCRKLAFLDTCHSGAIEPLKHANVKAALRGLQEDIIFTVTATTGDELAQESKAWGHGAFTKVLLDGIAGAADFSKDHQITLVELIDYVKLRVPKITGQSQHPMAAPDELLPFVSFPLAQATQVTTSTPAN